MNVRDKIPLKSLQFLALGLGTAFLAVSIPLASQETQSIKIDGSSTVYPITKEVAERFQASSKKPVDINIEFSGTGGGFDKFCRRETDINNASRPIQLDEMKAVAINSGNGVVLPSRETVEQAEYQPLRQFIDFYLLTIPELLRKQARF